VGGDRHIAGGLFAVSCGCSFFPRLATGTLFYSSFAAHDVASSLGGHFHLNALTFSPMLFGPVARAVKRTTFAGAPIAIAGHDLAYVQLCA